MVGKKRAKNDSTRSEINIQNYGEVENKHETDHLNILANTHAKVNTRLVD